MNSVRLNEHGFSSFCKSVRLVVRKSLRIGELFGYLFVLVKAGHIGFARNYRVNERIALRGFSRLKHLYFSGIFFEMIKI